jgi:transcription elongation GreA/GreB family factor
MKGKLEKATVLSALNELVSQRILEAQNEIESINYSKESETKSSAGDKYETGMSMLQMEEQKAAVQLVKARELRQTLSMIGPEEKHLKVQLGSLVTTTNGIYFISIGLGKIVVKDQDVFVLSITSPIGLQLKDKSAGEKFLFQGNEIAILLVN